jgi:hypothetical protein
LKVDIDKTRENSTGDAVKRNTGLLAIKRVVRAALKEQSCKKSIRSEPPDTDEKHTLRIEASKSKKKRMKMIPNKTLPLFAS